MNFSQLTILLLSLFFISVNSYSQKNKNLECKCKELDKYYKQENKKWENYIFKPKNVEIIKKVPFPFVKIHKISNPTKYSGKSNFILALDSLKAIYHKESFSTIDSLLEILSNVRIDNIPKLLIVKEVKIQNHWYILYTNLKYEEPFDFKDGYWLAISNDNGSSWKKYYTGLVENYYYYFNRESKISLLKNDNTLQIECAITRLEKQAIRPIGSPTFGLVQDGLVIEIEMSEIIKDSDNDGLTDIVENKMLLNPTNSDSDGDGINDGEDSNPRFPSKKNDFTEIYETIFNQKFDSEGNPEIKEIPILIVTDDKNLKSINPKSHKIIFITNKEYEKYQVDYPSPFMKEDVTPIFKCDRLKNSYRVDSSGHLGGTNYLIQKNGKVWKATIIGMLMI